MSYRTLVPARNSILALVLFAGCQSQPHGHWAGTWQGDRPDYGGDLHCNVEQINEQQWRAAFTGYCGRFFAYKITMDGRAEGDAVAFGGKQDLGEADGGIYHWTGRIEGDSFHGRYRSEKGKIGTFTMTRQ